MGQVLKGIETEMVEASTGTDCWSRL